MPSSVNDAWKYLEERFEVEQDDLKGYKIEKVSGDYWLCSEQLETDLETETKGFRFLRKSDRGLKPTTYALQFLGDRLQKNIVDLDKEEFLELLKRKEMISRDRECLKSSCELCSCKSSNRCCGEGYVALRFEGKIYGCGFYMDGVVSSRVPKGRGKELAKIIGEE